MAPPTTPPSSTRGHEPKSILGRLSLSPSHKAQAPPASTSAEASSRASQKNGPRSAWTPERYPTQVVAGPSYESMSPQTPPRRTPALNEQSAYHGDSGSLESMNGGDGRTWSPLRTGDKSQSMFPHALQWLTLVDKPANTKLGPDRTFGSQPSSHAMHPSLSPPRARNPIYPALASPPRDYSATVLPSPPVRDSPASSERPSALQVDTSSPRMYPRTNSSSRTVTKASPGAYQTTSQKLIYSITYTEPKKFAHHRIFALSTTKRLHFGFASTCRQTGSPNDEHTTVRRQ